MGYSYSFLLCIVPFISLYRYTAVGQFSASEGWKQLGRTSYLFNYSARISFNDAKVACQSLGADLALSKTKKINQFITDYITPGLTETRCFWIGLTDHGEEGYFEWSDGTPLGFQGWSGPMPDNSWPDQDCACVWSSTLTYRHGGWNDNWCYQSEPYICQKETGLCEVTDFRCTRSGRCIPAEWRCDTGNDCDDESDEQDCGGRVCNLDQFWCNGTDDTRCIPASYRCDLDEDCPDGSDEDGCETSIIMTNDSCLVGVCEHHHYHGWMCSPIVELCIEGADWAICSTIPSTSRQNTTLRCMLMEEYHLSTVQKDDMLSLLQSWYAPKLYDDWLATLRDYSPEIVNETVLKALQRKVTHMHLEHNAVAHVEPGVFRGFLNMATLYLRNNLITRLDSGVLQDIAGWGILFSFSNNDMTHIGNGSFHNLTVLLYLFLENSNVCEIDSSAFEDLVSLEIMSLASNHITEFKPRLFQNLQKLEILYLDNNELSILEPDIFEGTVGLTSVNLTNNRLESLPLTLFSKTKAIKYIRLAINQIREIQPGTFAGLDKLQELNLSSNVIQELKSDVVSGLRALQLLDLSYNSIKYIEAGSFHNLTNLLYLFLIGTELGQVHPDTLFGLVSLQALSTSDERLCCLLDRMNGESAVNCTRTSQSSPLDTCGSIFSSIALRVAGWVLGISALIGNALVLYIRSARRLDIHGTAVQNNFVNSLAVADSIMGAYMLIIVAADLYYGDQYYLSAPQWRESSVCLLAGFLGFLSSEASVFTLTLITVDRFISIVFPFATCKINSRISIFCIVAVWVFTIILSLVPLLLIPVRPDIYGLSDVCIGLPLHVESVGSGALQVLRDESYEPVGVIFVQSQVETKPPWLFSIIIFLVVNFGSFLFILSAYAVIFIKIMRSAASVRNTGGREREIKVAKRMTIIIATDFICWMPVIILGILSQSGSVELPSAVYAWIVIFVVPVNASINPFIYTFMLISDKRKDVNSKERTSGQTQEEEQRSRVDMVDVSPELPD